ncbi:hypothetical protein FISHEDRAFT_62150 [Fistulina hepatica ATCC 64428]|nr:hypothetical protein FISHEDRAFT_62150 [Fistulina hepatica ATCC 64428]
MPSIALESLERANASHDDIRWGLDSVLRIRDRNDRDRARSGSAYGTRRLSSTPTIRSDTPPELPSPLPNSPFMPSMLTSPTISVTPSISQTMTASMSMPEQEPYDSRSHRKLELVSHSSTAPVYEPLWPVAICLCQYPALPHATPPAIILRVGPPSQCMTRRQWDLMSPSPSPSAYVNATRHASNPSQASYKSVNSLYSHMSAKTFPVPTVPPPVPRRPGAECIGRLSVESHGGDRIPSCSAIPAATYNYTPSNMDLPHNITMCSAASAVYNPGVTRNPELSRTVAAYSVGYEEDMSRTSSYDSSSTGRLLNRPHSNTLNVGGRPTSRSCMISSKPSRPCPSLPL